MHSSLPHIVINIYAQTRIQTQVVAEARRNGLRLIVGARALLRQLTYCALVFSIHYN